MNSNYVTLEGKSLAELCDNFQKSCMFFHLCFERFVFSIDMTFFLNLLSIFDVFVVIIV